ncbi:MAG: hypothetical protein E7437_04195 [Ruminococcaceae bacterium]|nr:hypothetical protein [Oscillospiraceae bacterium]
MSRYMPVYQYPDMMPVDISFVFEDEKPAGKHGFCKVQGESFVFEDGTPAKFWGVIFNGASCFPSHEYAEGVAQRLAQAGCNYVRFHQMDADWATPNLFRFSAGKPTRTTRKLDERSMERMDYLIKCLKDQGIYAGVDMMTYRKFKPGDGVAFAEDMWDAHKQYALYDPWMITLQKEFCDNFWNHYNPYTGLAYKDDPFFTFCVIANENDMFRPFNNYKWKRIAYYDDMLRDMFDKWLKEQGIEYDAFGCDLNVVDETQARFRSKVNEDYAKTMYGHIRSLGVKIPLACTNWYKSNALTRAQKDMDFQDGHSYYYDWSWTEYEKVSNNKSLMEQKSSPVGNAIATRIHGQPFTMTEWDMPWPNSYRCESPIWFPAMACLQNFSAMSIHTYGYHTKRDQYSLLGKESSSNTLGMTPFREGLFTCWNDPAKFGLFYHGALMLRRGDVSPAKHVIGAKLSADYAAKDTKLASTGACVHQIHTVLDSTDTSDLTDIRSAAEVFPRENPNMVVSDTGEVWRDFTRRIGGVDSPRTQAVFGVIGQRRANGGNPIVLELSSMKVQANTDLATIALSSLTDDPIEKSDSMLLSAVGRASNRGQRMDGEKLLDIGTGPIEAEIIDAQIAIKTDNEKLRVWSVNSEGFYIGNPEAEHKDGWMHFHIGPKYPGLYYLIMEY